MSLRLPLKGFSNNYYYNKEKLPHPLTQSNVFLESDENYRKVLRKVLLVFGSTRD